jgi:hypothetical protein
MEHAMQKVVKKPVAANAAHYREIPPNAAKTLLALREMGYDSFASVMDIVDNAIDAKASKVDVTVRQLSAKSLIIDILDNGMGMDEAILEQALRLGSDTVKTDGDLGKFGMGLVTASLSMAKSIFVVTRKSGGAALEAALDLDTVQRENKFLITLRTASAKHAEEVGNHGTLVRLSEIDRINDTNVARFAANLRTQLGQVYRHFIDSGVVLTVNRRTVPAYDPLMLSHEITEVVLDTTLDMGDGRVAKLKVVELPELGQSGDAEANIFPHNSGFYVVRNGREIMAGQTFGFYRHHHSYSHFRAELAFTGASDSLWHVDIKKSTIHPDDKLLEKLKAKTEKLIAQSGRRGRDRGEERPVKLSHGTAAAAINARLTESTPGPLAATQGDEKAFKDRKAARVSKAAVEAAADVVPPVEQAPAAPPPKPTVEFVEVDGGDKGRFFSATRENGRIVVAYNTRHPFVRMVAESKQRQASAILDYVAFALAQVESEIPGADKVVNRVCDHLKELVPA